MIIGIDPGFTGAVALLNNNLFDDYTLEIHDLPLKKIMGHRQIDVRVLAACFRAVQRNFEIQFAAIEDVHSMPRDGVASAFKFGYNAGILLGVLETLGIKVLRVKPNVWKPALGLSSNKKESLALAKKVFPSYSHYFQRAKDDGRAEAALIAHFARESL